MEERITTGMSVAFSGESETEPVTLAEMKTFLNFIFTLHDATLTSLIKTVRMEFEQQKSISLVTRTVDVFWQKLYDFEDLPFGPVTTSISSIVVKDADDIVIDSTNYKIQGVGGFLRIVGDFENGCKISYETGYGTVLQTHKQAIIDSVFDIFVNKLSLAESVFKNCKNLSL